MQFPESWLREFCNPSLTTQQLADTLTMAGLEVEELEPVAPPFTKIVVGEIKEAVQHPNADRLRVCQVDVGQGSLLNIVCGAPNARVGIRVPCAMVGAELPPGEDGKPFVIKVGKLRGVESQGMLCSARELKLSEDHGGLLELPADAVVGRNIREVLPPDAVAQCHAAMAEARRDGVSRGKRLQLVVPDGVRHFELSVARASDGVGGGGAHFLVLSRDVTQAVRDARGRPREVRIVFPARPTRSVAATEVAAMDIAGALAPFDLKNQLSSNRTQGVPNMISLVKRHAERIAAG